MKVRAQDDMHFKKEFYFAYTRQKKGFAYLCKQHFRNDYFFTLIFTLFIQSRCCFDLISTAVYSVGYLIEKGCLKIERLYDNERNNEINRKPYTML